MCDFGTDCADCGARGRETTTTTITTVKPTEPDKPAKSITPGTTKKKPAASVVAAIKRSAPKTLYLACGVVELRGIADLSTKTRDSFRAALAHYVGMPATSVQIAGTVATTFYQNAGHRRRRLASLGAATRFLAAGSTHKAVLVGVSVQTYGAAMSNKVLGKLNSIQTDHLAFLALLTMRGVPGVFGVALRGNPEIWNDLFQFKNTWKTYYNIAPVQVKKLMPKVAAVTAPSVSAAIKQRSSTLGLRAG